MPAAGINRRQDSGQPFCYWVRECTLSMANSAFCPWQTRQLSPSEVVLASACAAVALSSWQPWQAAAMGAVVGVNPPVLATMATAPTLSGWYELFTWQVLQSRTSPGN